MRLRTLLGVLAFQWAVCMDVGEAAAEPSSASLDAIRAYREQNAARILDELVTFLAIPNVASDAVNIRRNAQHLIDMLQARGVTARLLEAEGSPPAVYGELMAPGARRTVVFYAHYDGQPADASHWQSAPWTPTLRSGALADAVATLPLSALQAEADPEWRLFARSASDDKSPIVAMLAGLDAVRAAGAQPSVSLKFFFEGEEEAGSPHLETLLTENANLLAADVWIFCDGPVHQSGASQVVFGVRGVVGVEITVYGPLRALHSGHYGNWAPNPAAALATLVGSLRAPDGRILIDGFYDDIRAPTQAELAAVREVPAVESQLLHELALASSEAPETLVLERILQPALNVRGLSSGAVGEAARNAIPTEAHASFDFRLVPDQEPRRVQQLFETHLERLGYVIVRDTPSVEQRRQHAKLARVRWQPGYPAMRTNMELDVSRAIVRAVEEASAMPVARVPTLGGSLPLHLFRSVLGAPLVVVPMVNHDNNQHAPDENLRLQNLWNGIDVYANVILRLGALWDGE